jgi:hypothetical protein
MTSPSHGEDRRFNSGRAHIETHQGRIEPATINLSGIAEFVGAGSIPAEPISKRLEAGLKQPRTTCKESLSSLAPVQFRPNPLQNESIPAEPTAHDEF